MARSLVSKKSHKVSLPVGLSTNVYLNSKCKTNVATPAFKSINASFLAPERTCRLLPSWPNGRLQALLRASWSSPFKKRVDKTRRKNEIKEGECSMKTSREKKKKHLDGRPLNPQRSAP